MRRAKPAGGEGSHPLSSSWMQHSSMAVQELLRQDTLKAREKTRTQTYVCFNLFEELIIIILTVMFSPAPTAQQSQATVKDSSLCIIPECGQPKYVEGSIVHSYCGKWHAELGKKKGILRKPFPLNTLHNSLIFFLFFHSYCSNSLNTATVCSCINCSKG